MLLRLPLSIVLGITLSTSASSPWNRARFLTISFAKSRVPYCPSTMGCTKDCHSLSHNSPKLTTSLAAAFARESQTAPVKRLHSHEESSSLESGGGVLSFSREGSDVEGGNMEGGERVTIASDCLRSYGGKWIWGTPVVWRKRGRGAVTIRTTVIFDIYHC